MHKLIELKKNDIFTNSKVIADGTNNQHKNVKELIVKYQTDIEDFGTLSVSNVESTGQWNLFDTYRVKPVRNIR